MAPCGKFQVRTVSMAPCGKFQVKTLVKHALLNCLMVFNICANSFQNVTSPSRVIEWTHQTVIQCLTLNYDLHLAPTLVKHMH